MALRQGFGVRAVEGTQKADTASLACLSPGARIGSSLKVKSLFLFSAFSRLHVSEKFPAELLLSGTDDPVP